MVTNKEIMTWVIEYNIYRYYNGIIEHIIETNPGAFTDVGPDRIKETMVIADDIFKNVTGTNIYEAIGLAYDYAPSTIKKKINRQTQRTICWAAFKRPAYASSNCPIQMDSLVKQQYYIYSVLKKLPNFIDFSATLDVVELSEDRIVDITKMLTERANSIYGDGTVGDISPALVVWDQYVIDSKIKKDIQTEKKKKKSYGHYEFDIIKELVAIQHRNHCTNAIYHLDYDDCMYEISITAVPYSK